MTFKMSQKINRNQNCWWVKVIVWIGEKVVWIGEKKWLEW